MTLVQSLAAVAALAVAFAPQLQLLVQWAIGLWQGVPVVPPPKPLEEAIAPPYQEAIASLVTVRTRLVVTERLADDQKKAIDTLTLALVDGSDL
jgi:hypothetical protein